MLQPPAERPMSKSSVLAFKAFRASSCASDRSIQMSHMKSNLNPISKCPRSSVYLCPCFGHLCPSLAKIFLMTGSEACAVASAAAPMPGHCGCLKALQQPLDEGWPIKSES